MFLSSGRETSIITQVLDFRSWMTMSDLLAKIFLSVIIESHKMVFSFIFTTLRVVCVHTICWELHNQAHGILPNEHSWPPCYVGANIQLMPCNMPLMWLTVSWALPLTLQLPSICFFKILSWSLVLNDWSWAATIKLSVSPLSPALLNQAQLASLSTKGFQCCKKLSMHWFLPQFF